MVIEHPSEEIIFELKAERQEIVNHGKNQGKFIGSNWNIKCRDFGALKSEQRNFYVVLERAYCMQLSWKVSRTEIIHLAVGHGQGFGFYSEMGGMPSYTSSAVLWFANCRKSRVKAKWWEWQFFMVDKTT